MPSKHVVLLGDSTLDNGSYVPARQDVRSQLQDLLPGDAVTLLAVDGSTIEGMERQLRQVPAGASHLIVSVGGNDALGYTRVFEEGATSVAEALNLLASVRDAFARDYGEMLDAVLRLGLPTAICTIYDAAFEDLQYARIGSTGLALLNDSITREAGVRGVPLIDLRTIFDSREDYANAIEPSSGGGRKLAAAIAAVAATHDFSGRRAAIYGPAATGNP